MQADRVGDRDVPADAALMPLGGVTVVDATTWLGGYAGRLLSDLGAEVRSVMPSPDPEDPAEIMRRFGKTQAPTSEPDAQLGELLNDALVDDATILITDVGPAELRARGLHPDQTTAGRPALIHVAITPYGLTGPSADKPASDLVLLADGGLLYLCGDPDRSPVRPFGEQSATITSLHATVATLMALTARDADGLGQVIDVSAQEAIVHTLENAMQYYDLEGVVRRRRGSSPADAGVGLFACRDGYIYLLTTMGGKKLSWDAAVDWLVESGTAGAERLRDPDWDSSAFRRTPEAIAEFRRIFETFSGARSKDEIYLGAQERGVSIAPVFEPHDLLESSQLRARDFFHDEQVFGHTIPMPGLPYRFGDGTVGRFTMPQPAAARPGGGS